MSARESSNASSAIPEIAVSDMARAIEYYRDRLGFDIDWEANDISLAGVSRGTCRIFLAGPAFREGRAPPTPAYTWINLHGKAEVDRLYAEWLDRGAVLLEPPESKSWGLHEFRAADLDGNRFRVFYDFATPAREPSPRLSSLAPQLLVTDLPRAMAFYRRLGFAFGEPWSGFYAIGRRDGFELHLKLPPAGTARRSRRDGQRIDDERLDATAGVDGIQALHAALVADGVPILRGLAPTGWGTLDFVVEDPDGNLVCFGGRPVAEPPNDAP